MSETLGQRAGPVLAFFDAWEELSTKDVAYDKALASCSSDCIDLESLREMDSLRRCGAPISDHCPKKCSAGPCLLTVKANLASVFLSVAGEQGRLGPLCDYKTLLLVMK